MATTNVSYEAMIFARFIHRDQKRKYSGNPYFDHLAEVAGLVASVGGDETSIAVAFLHDSAEDQNIQHEELVDRFGMVVAQGVFLLSDLETGNRATRKALSCERLAGAPGWVQTIKCADLISNTTSIVQHDPDFAKVYLHEKQRLIEVLTSADPRLLELSRDNVYAQINLLKETE